MLFALGFTMEDAFVDGVYMLEGVYLLGIAWGNCVFTFHCGCCLLRGSSLPRTGMSGFEW